MNHAVTYYTRREKVCFGVSKPKTEAGNRLIPMMDTVYDALKNEYDRQKKDAYLICINVRYTTSIEKICNLLLHGFRHSMDHFQV